MRGDYKDGVADGILLSRGAIEKLKINICAETPAGIDFNENEAEYIKQLCWLAVDNLLYRED